MKNAQGFRNVYGSMLLRRGADADTVGDSLATPIRKLYLAVIDGYRACCAT
jgi:hypothetical protein